VLYDPFTGCATTNVVANFLGVKSIGCERNPFFYKIGLAKCKAKIVFENLNTIRDDFIQIATALDNEINLEKEYSNSALLFLQKLFSEASLSTLTLIKKHIATKSEDYQLASFLYLSKILDSVTHSKTDGVYKAPTSAKKGKTIIDAIEENYVLLTSDKDYSVKYSDNAKLIFESSTNYKPAKSSIDIVVFSPPYLNNFDFAEMTRMYMYFWDEAKDWKEISDKHRNSMLINTTTALRNVRDSQIQSDL